MALRITWKDLKKNFTPKKIVAVLVFTIMFFCFVKVFMFIYISSVVVWLFVAERLNESGRTDLVLLIPTVIKWTIAYLIGGVVLFFVHSYTKKWMT